MIYLRVEQKLVPHIIRHVVILLIHEFEQAIHDVRFFEALKNQLIRSTRTSNKLQHRRVVAQGLVRSL